MNVILDKCAITTLVVHPFDKCIISKFSHGGILVIYLATFTVFFTKCVTTDAVLVFTVYQALRNKPFKTMAITGDAYTVSILPTDEHGRNVNLCKLDGGFTVTVTPSVNVCLRGLINDCVMLF